MKNNTRPWFPIVTVAMLALQSALLWLQGVMLNRQHAEIASLRVEIRELAIALHETLSEEDIDYMTPAYGVRPRSSQSRFEMQDKEQYATADGIYYFRPAKSRHTPFIYTSAQAEDSTRRELEKSRESAREAVKQARETQEKLSLSENARKAEEKAVIEREKYKWHRRLGIALLVAVAAYFIGVWLNKRK